MVGNKFRPYNADRYSLLNAAADETIGSAISFHDCRQVSWEIVGAGTIASGTVKIETNDVAKDYAGTWYELDSLDASTLTDGKVYHGTYPGAVGWVRGRVSDAIVGGGDVSVPLNGLLQ